MSLNIYNTHTLLMAVEQLVPESTFLKDRYFPTNAATDIFSTDYVLVEYKDGNRKVAPFVAPRKGGVTMLRQGSEMKQFEPPFIAPRRILTIDELKKRGFGEALLSTMTPAQRQLTMLLRDASELAKMITRREEVMAAETMLTNGCIMKHIADDHTEGDDKEIRFYDGDSNPSQYTVTTKWNEENANIIGDLAAMIRMLTSKGLPAEDLIVSPDVADIILNNPIIQKIMDIRNFHLGEVKPIELPNGATRIAVLNVKGRNINVICYEEQYEDENGELKNYIPDGTVILSAPAAGRTAYGAVTQVEQADGEFHTYAGKRVPKYISDAQGNTRTLTLTSCPILMPNHKNPWVVAKVTD